MMNQFPVIFSFTELFSHDMYQNTAVKVELNKAKIHFIEEKKTFFFSPETFFTFSSQKKTKIGKRRHVAIFYA
jgi:hypothetical protein